MRWLLLPLSVEPILAKPLVSQKINTKCSRNGVKLLKGDGVGLYLLGIIVEKILCGMEAVVQRVVP